MGGEQSGDPLTRQVAQQGQDAPLVAQVQVGRRLVQQQDRRFLGDGASDENQLVLSAAQVCHIPVGQRRDPQTLQRSPGGANVVRARHLQKPQVRCPPQQDVVQNGVVERDVLPLRDQADQTAEALAGVVPQRPARQTDFPPLRNV